VRERERGEEGERESLSNCDWEKRRYTWSAVQCYVCEGVAVEVRVSGYSGGSGSSRSSPGVWRGGSQLLLPTLQQSAHLRKGNS